MPNKPDTQTRLAIAIHEEKCSQLRIPTDATKWDALETAVAIKSNKRAAIDFATATTLHRRRQAESEDSQLCDRASTKAKAQILTAETGMPEKQIWLDKDEYVYVPDIRMTNPDLFGWKMKFGATRKDDANEGELVSPKTVPEKRVANTAVEDIDPKPVKVEVRYFTVEYDDPSLNGGNAPVCGPLAQADNSSIERPHATTLPLTDGTLDLTPDSPWPPVEASDAVPLSLTDEIPNRALGSPRFPSAPVSIVREALVVYEFRAAEQVPPPLLPQLENDTLSPSYIYTLNRRAEVVGLPASANDWDTLEVAAVIMAGRNLRLSNATVQTLQHREQARELARTNPSAAAALIELERSQNVEDPADERTRALRHCDWYEVNGAEVEIEMKLVPGEDALVQIPAVDCTMPELED